jgi:hypothetical protein
MTKAPILGLAVAACACVLLITRAGGDAQAALPDDVLLSLGDTIRLEDVPVGCRVTRLPRHGKRIFLDCRRGGRLAGTYGVFFSAGDVLVVRYLGPRRAKTVLHARHEGEATRCK